MIMNFLELWRCLRRLQACNKCLLSTSAESDDSMQQFTTFFPVQGPLIKLTVRVHLIHTCEQQGMAPMLTIDPKSFGLTVHVLKLSDQSLKYLVQSSSHPSFSLAPLLQHHFRGARKEHVLEVQQSLPKYRIIVFLFILIIEGPKRECRMPKLQISISANANTGKIKISSPTYLRFSKNIKNLKTFKLLFRNYEANITLALVVLWKQQALANTVSPARDLVMIGRLTFALFHCNFSPEEGKGMKARLIIFMANNTMMINGGTLHSNSSSHAWEDTSPMFRSRYITNIIASAQFLHAAHNNVIHVTAAKKQMSALDDRVYGPLQYSMLSGQKPKQSLKRKQQF